MKNCKFCQNTFQVTKDRQEFCGHKCQAKFQIRRMKSPGKKKNGKNLLCKICKEEFYIPRYRVLKGEASYCSRSCLAKDHLKKYIKIHGFQKLNLPKRKYKWITVNGKQVREHRWLMEQKMGRKLEKWEHVHHINGDGMDNRMENLCLLCNSDHQKMEHIIRAQVLSGVL